MKRGGVVWVMGGGGVRVTVRNGKDWGMCCGRVSRIVNNVVEEE